MRVPLIINFTVRETWLYLARGAQFESILKFTEEVFALPNLGVRDATADDLLDGFDFSHSNPTIPLSQRVCP